MNDAAEVLRMIYDALIDQGHRDMVTSCFGLDIHESVRCRHCDMETHALRYTQYFQVQYFSHQDTSLCTCTQCCSMVSSRSRQAHAVMRMVM
jgi:hypothetical protein